MSRNFRIDQISNMVIADEPARKGADFEYKLKNYEDLVVLNYHESINKALEEIFIKATTKQLKYLRSLPLLKSQVWVDELVRSNCVALTLI